MRKTRNKFIVCVGSFIFFLVLLEICLRIAGFFLLQKTSSPLNKSHNNNAITILTLGDSYTVGGEGVLADNYPSQLQNQLSLHYPGKYTVLNGGICEANTRIVWERFNHILKNHKIDQVILLAGSANKFNLAGYHQFKTRSVLARLRLYKLFHIFIVNLKGKMLQKEAIYFDQQNISNHETIDMFRQPCKPYENIIKSNPDDVFAHYKLAECYILDVDMTVNKKGLDIFKNIIAQEKYYSSILQMSLSLLGDYYRGCGNYQDAVALYKETIRKYPKELWAYGELASVYLMQEEMDSAIEVYETVKNLDIPQKDATLLMWRGQYYDFIGKYKVAENFYLNAIKTDPGTRLAYEYLGRLYLKSGDFPKAFDMFAQAIEHAPENFNLYYLLVKAYEFQNRHDARTILQTLRRMEKNRPELKGSKIFQDYISYFSDQAKKEKMIKSWLKEDLENIVNLCLQKNIKVIIQNYPYPYNTPNQVLKEIAEKYSLVFIDNYSIFKNLDNYDSYFVDSDHLTTEGHRIMAENIYRKIEPQ